MTNSKGRLRARSLAPVLGLILSLASQQARANDDAASAPAPAPAPTPTPSQQKTDNGIAEGSDIVVTGTKANTIAPVTASLTETQPASIISRSFIEDSLPASADFNDIALISPSVANAGGENGVGLNESKTTIRGFQDGEYNITYDGIPFGDTNGPTHHSNTFFPSNTIETLVVDRGPGNASQLGESTYGGNMNLFSRETRADPSAEFKGSFGSFDTYLLRGLFQTGAIDKLNGTEAVVSVQYIKTDGRLSLSGYNQKNLFGKIVIPIASNVHLTLLSTYNKNHFFQPDKNGVTLQQVALYGKYYNLNNDPTSESYYNYNKTTKTTDFEVAKLDADIAPGTTFTNSAYTYYYDNETLSGSSATTIPVSAGGPPTTVTLSGAAGTKAVPGVPGYTKTNKYRVWGDIPKMKINLGFGTLTTGIWIERADTFRQQTDVDLVTGAFNYVEKTIKLPNGSPNPLGAPGYVKFNQNSGFNHTEEFAEFELRPLPGLTITPGYKHVDFNLEINAEYNQTTRVPQTISKTYSRDLPFATINYAVTSRLSVYGQYAKGMAVPILGDLYVNNPSLSSIQPQTSTNYQAGFVYHGNRLSLDADVYDININNKIQQETVIDDTGTSQTAYFNAGRVLYKGIEGQATYALPAGFAVFANGSINYAKEAVTHNPVSNAPKSTAAAGLLYKAGPIRFSLIDKWTGPQYATSEALDPTQTFFVVTRAARISPYNTAILAASYQWHSIRFGLNVTDLFNSEKIENLGLSGNGPASNPAYGLNTTGDQLYYQPGRQITGDITVKFLMRRVALFLASAMLVAAAGQKPTAPLLLNASNLDPALVLPDPPRDGTKLAKAELAELHAVDTTRTPEEVARAKADGETKNVTIFANVMGTAFDLDKLPATKALFHTVREEEKAAADRAKDHFKRNRPWIVDASLHSCSINDDPQSSYPSGHTTMGYSMASILARLVPSKAPAIMARAAEYAHSRLVCEVHFPSDVTAGQSYGMMVAERLMEKPAFQTQFTAARRELVKAGLTPS